jgi:hypothetical protein
MFTPQKYETQNWVNRNTWKYMESKTYYMTSTESSNPHTTEQQVRRYEREKNTQSTIVALSKTIMHTDQI